MRDAMAYERLLEKRNPVREEGNLTVGASPFLVVCCLLDDACFGGGRISSQGGAKSVIYFDCDVGWYGWLCRQEVAAHFKKAGLVPEAYAQKVRHRLSPQVSCVCTGLDSFPVLAGCSVLTSEREFRGGHLHFVALCWHHSPVLQFVLPAQWFVGLCVHTMPFAPLIDLFEAFLQEGHMFLFKLSQAIIDATKDRLLETKPTEVNKIFELLRLDKKFFPDALEGESQFFSKIVTAAKAMDLNADEVKTVRDQEMKVLQEKLVKVPLFPSSVPATYNSKTVIADYAAAHFSWSLPAHSGVASGPDLVSLVLRFR